MSVLEISEARAEELDKLEGAAIKILMGYLEGKRSGGDDVKIAKDSMSIVAKTRQSNNAMQALKFSMVGTLTDDPKVMRKYIQSTQPEIKKLMA